MAHELQDFNNDVVIQSKTTPVVIDFWAEWCGPCRTLTPVLEKLAAEARGQWKLVKINTEEHRQIAAQFGIRSIPSVKMVYQGAIIAEFQGALPEPAVRKWLQDHLPADQDSEMETEMLQTLLQAGEREKALEICEEQLKEADSPELRARVAMLNLPGEIARAEAMLASLQDEQKFEIEKETLNTIRHLKMSDTATLADAGNPAAAESYKNGIKALFSGDYEHSIESFLDAMIRDRKLDNDGARKALIAIFTILTDHHPLSIKYRRRFSMALY
ncbi:MAG: thioredoxin [Cyclonatronaceae bacterium]